MGTDISVVSLVPPSARSQAATSDIYMGPNEMLQCKTPVADSKLLLIRRTLYILHNSNISAVLCDLKLAKQKISSLSSRFS